MSESSGDAARENETQARIVRQTKEYQSLLDKFDENAQPEISNFFFGKFTDFIYDTFGIYIDYNNPENSEFFMKDYAIKNTQEFKKLLIDAVMKDENDDSISKLNDILTSIYNGNDLKENKDALKKIKDALKKIITEAQKFKKYKNFIETNFIETIINDTVESRVPEQESTPGQPSSEQPSPGQPSPGPPPPPGQPSPGQPSPGQRRRIAQLQRAVATKKSAGASNEGGTKTKKRNVRKTRRSKKTKRSKSRRHSRK